MVSVEAVFFGEMAEGSLLAEGSLSAEGSLLAEGSLSAEGSFSAEGSVVVFVTSGSASFANIANSTGSTGIGVICALRLGFITK